MQRNWHFKIAHRLNNFPQSPSGGAGRRLWIREKGSFPCLSTCVCVWHEGGGREWGSCPCVSGTPWWPWPWMYKTIAQPALGWARGGWPLNTGGTGHIPVSHSLNPAQDGTNHAFLLLIRTNLAIKRYFFLWNDACRASEISGDHDGS